MKKDVMKILIAEDDKLCATTIKFILQSAGYDVIMAQNGNEAWQNLQHESAPKLVILDWMMPGMSGIDVLRKLRRKEINENTHTYVIMLTVKSTKEDMQTAREAGADYYLTKPYLKSHLIKLIKLVEKVLSKRRPVENDSQTIGFETIIQLHTS